MLLVQFTASAVWPKGCYYNNLHRHSNTFSLPFGYLHSLDDPFAFHLVIFNKKNASDTLLLTGSFERAADLAVVLSTMKS